MSRRRFVIWCDCGSKTPVVAHEGSEWAKCKECDREYRMKVHVEMQRAYTDVAEKRSLHDIQAEARKRATRDMEMQS